MSTSPPSGPSFPNNIERWKCMKSSVSTPPADPIYGNINPSGVAIQRMSSVESDPELPLPPAPAMNYSPPINQSFPDPPNELLLPLCPQVEQGPPPRYHPCPGYIEPVRIMDEIPSNGIYANYRPVSYASTCDASASLYEQPIGNNNRGSSDGSSHGLPNISSLSIGSGGGSCGSSGSRNGSYGSDTGISGTHPVYATNYASVNCIQVNYDPSTNLYANLQEVQQQVPSTSSLKSGGKINVQQQQSQQQQVYSQQKYNHNNNNFDPSGRYKFQQQPIKSAISSAGSNNHCAIGHGVSGYPAVTGSMVKQLSPRADHHQLNQMRNHHQKIDERVIVPITAPSPSSIQSHHQLQQSCSRSGGGGGAVGVHRLESLKPGTKEDEVDQLTNLLVQSMGSSNDPDFYGICFKCKKKVIGEGNGCKAMDNIYHIKCFTCKTCGKQLKGLTFYNVDGRPLCESDYLNTLEKCSVCIKPILDRILRATGKPYHPDCFTCIVCKKCLDGIPFTVDNQGKIHCIEDFHRKFAPRCYVCTQPILPEPGQHETVRVVALDRSYHVNCYRCEDCQIQLTSKDEGSGCYPLDNHILCKDCNARRVNELTAV